jgi:hypothetical protein
LAISCRRRVRGNLPCDCFEGRKAYDLVLTGIDLTQPPSKMTLMKLAMDGEFRIAITKVMTELKQAGVDVTPEVGNDLEISRSRELSSL